MFFSSATLIDLCIPVLELTCPTCTAIDDVTSLSEFPVALGTLADMIHVLTRNSYSSNTAMRIDIPMHWHIPGTIW